VQQDVNALWYEAVRDAPCESADLIVLASGSTGNCSVLVLTIAQRQVVYLLDAGLSPRRTRRLLAEHQLETAVFAGIVLTHLDTDHWHPGWPNATLPGRSRVHVHRCHKGRAGRSGTLYLPTEIVDEEFELLGGVRVRTHLNPHDDLGSVAFRMDVRATASVAGAESASRGSLGFATDLGRVPQSLLELFRGVDVLALESNYCPTLQLASRRSDATKDRIMGGAGHLSNQQSSRAVQEMSPRRHVVLLHLSQECNTPEVAQAAHRHAVPVTLTHAKLPTPRIAVARPEWTDRSPPRVEVPMPRTLWDVGQHIR
jgi:ribonuclease BN (tRNA processing enzyme)